MKRYISLLLALGLVFGLVASAHAKKKAKPITSTFYFHGTETVGEVDLVNNFGLAYSPMDANKPEGDAPKSLQFVTWHGDPQAWNDCAGMYTLPVWSGNVAGKFVGDMKVTLHTVSAPKSVTIQVWPDLMSQTCASNDLTVGEYKPPAAQATVELPAGHGMTEVVLEDVNFKAVGRLTLQLLPEGPAPGRILYDAAGFESSIEFSCIPTSGTTCVP